MQSRPDVPLNENTAIVSRLKVMENFSLSIGIASVQHQLSFVRIREAIYGAALAFVAEACSEKNTDVGRSVAVLDSYITILHQSQTAIVIGKY
jgi:hypothetical protein